MKVKKLKTGKYNRYSTVSKNTAKESLRQFWDVFQKDDDVLVVINLSENRQDRLNDVAERSQLSVCWSVMIVP